MSLNEIVNEYRGNTYVTNYKDLLAEREGNRTEARRNWKKIENIKELKQGYESGRSRHLQDDGGIQRYRYAGRLEHGIHARTAENRAQCV